MRKQENKILPRKIDASLLKRYLEVFEVTLRPRARLVDDRYLRVVYRCLRSSEISVALRLTQASLVTLGETLAENNATSYLQKEDLFLHSIAEIPGHFLN